MTRMSLILLGFISFQAYGFEEIMGVELADKGVTFQVSSSGCTSKEDFRFVVLESYPMGLILTREKIDPCEAYVPFGKKITFSYTELGFHPGAEFRILNPMQIFKVPAEEKVK